MELLFDRIFVTGDRHGNFCDLQDWCKENHITHRDLLIICGDSGIMYYGADSEKDKRLADFLHYECSGLNIMCVRGNHDCRPQNYYSHNIIDPCKEAGNMIVYPEIPNVVFMEDGSIININGKRCLFIGGAYSVDKYYRLMRGWHWFADEELSDTEMDNILKMLNSLENKHFDWVFTHTCPFLWEPVDLFINGVDQNTISKRMEKFLGAVERIITFDHWYFGHFHDNRIDMLGDGKVTMLYHDIKQII